VKTKWFVMADMGTGPCPLRTSGGRVALFEDLRGLSTIMKERGALRWQAYVWIFPVPIMITHGGTQVEVSRIEV
jgi:hypothetical protein